jgi:hypothetical protein
VQARTQAARRILSCFNNMVFRMTAIALLCLGAVAGALVAGPWWWRAAHADGYDMGVSDANALICGELNDAV